MFWKKKTPQNNKLEITHTSTDKRDAFRYEFKEGYGLKIKFMGNDIEVLDISAGGLAFKNQGFSQFDADFIRFELQIPNFSGDSSFFAGLRILRIDSNDICHCIFEQCSLEQHELIHKFVLEMQKNDLAH